MKLPDGPEILSDCGPFDGSNDDTDSTNGTDNTDEKRVVTNKLLKRRDKLFRKAARWTATSAKAQKAEEGPEVLFDDSGPPSFDIDQFEVNNDLPVDKSIIQNAAEAVEDDANNGAAQAFPANRPGDSRTPNTPNSASTHLSGESNRNSTAPLWLQDDTHDASYQLIQSRDAETGIQVASSLLMTDVVATHVGDDLVIQATPMGPSKWVLLTNAIKKHPWCVVTALLLIVAAVVAPAVLLTRPKVETSEPNIRNESITNAVIAVSGNSAFNTTTYQSKALTWLLDGGALDLSPEGPRLIQRYVLALMYYSLRGENWHDKHLFLSDANECDWSKYFVCNNSIVETIDLSSNNLRGSLPSEIGALQSLRTLVLYDNQLYDSIPQHLTMLFALQSLEIWGNSLTGTIPESIVGMSALQRLDLKFNQLTGTMPTSVGNLVNLKHLTASDNLLEGSIPSEFGRMTNLKSFVAYNNTLTGSIPTEIGQLTNLVTLWIASNSLHRSIPSEIGQLTDLIALSFCDNRLSGTIPAEIGLLKKLFSFSVYDNEQTGSVPSSVCDLNQTNLYINVDCTVNCSCCDRCY